MTTPHYSELVFDVVQDADGGYVADCLSENIVTQGDTWAELRANVKDAVEAYFFDGPKPQSIRLHLVRDEVFHMQ
ncbi:MAG TPA: type II toxin-antitoxin system HicB family antitoxin [Candidatus Sulfotelmatobacter sp.]|nr:type II toxin-antitoxin system HicB family antitoxin [Candidatus Sulfotelmatobacter sp.]